MSNRNYFVNDIVTIDELSNLKMFTIVQAHPHGVNYGLILWKDENVWRTLRGVPVVVSVPDTFKIHYIHAEPMVTEPDVDGWPVRFGFGVSNIRANQNEGSSMSDDQTFVQELASVINRRSMENASNTPDYILAQFLRDSLDVFNKAVVTRDQHNARPISRMAKETAEYLGLDENIVEDLFSKGWYVNYETMTFHNTGRVDMRNTVRDN